MILFHIKSNGKKSFLRQKTKIVGVSMVCVMLQVRKTVSDKCFMACADTK